MSQILVPVSDYAKGGTYNLTSGTTAYNLLSVNSTTDYIQGVAPASGSQSGHATMRLTAPITPYTSGDGELLVKVRTSQTGSTTQTLFQVDLLNSSFASLVSLTKRLKDLTTTFTDYTVTVPAADLPNVAYVKVVVYGVYINASIKPVSRCAYVQLTTPDGIALSHGLRMGCPF